MGLSAFVERLNAKLFPYIGPPPLGPYDEEPLPEASTRSCPMCGTAMTEHHVERREGRPTQLHCPVDAA